MEIVLSEAWGSDQVLPVCRLTVKSDVCGRVLTLIAERRVPLPLDKGSHGFGPLG